MVRQHFAAAILSIVFLALINTLPSAAKATTCAEIGINPTPETKLLSWLDVPEGYSGTLTVSFNKAYASQTAVAIENFTLSNGYWQIRCSWGGDQPFQVPVSQETQTRPIIIHVTSYPVLNSPGHGPCHPTTSKPGIRLGSPGQPIKASLDLFVRCSIANAGPGGPADLDLGTVNVILTRAP
jgi:hypothetical protein